MRKRITLGTAINGLIYQRETFIIRVWTVARICVCDGGRSGLLALRKRFLVNFPASVWQSTVRIPRSAACRELRNVLVVFVLSSTIIAMLRNRVDKIGLIAGAAIGNGPSQEPPDTP